MSAAEDVASHLEGAIRAVAASVTGRDARHVPEKAPPYALGEDRATDASAVQGQADVWRADRASDASSNVDFRWARAFVLLAGRLGWTPCPLWRVSLS